MLCMKRSIRSISFLLCPLLLLTSLLSLSSCGASPEDTPQEAQETLAPFVALPEIGPEAKLVAFTFDDGPSITGDIADLFASYQGHCTFFLIGQQIQDWNEPMVRRVSDMGCECGSHSMTHAHLTDLDDDAVRGELQQSAERIAAASGRSPVFFRPPYFKATETMYGMTDMIFISGKYGGDLDEDITAEELAQKLIYSFDGEIWALHETEKTLEALRIALPQLVERGFLFVTLSEMAEIMNQPIERLHGKMIDRLQYRPVS